MSVNICLTTIMCHNVNKKCIMCVKTIDSSLSLCAEGLLGRICVITPMNELSIEVKISHPRTGSRTYVDMRPFIVTVTQADICIDCIENAIKKMDENSIDIGLMIREVKSSPLTVDAGHINALINRHMKTRT